MSEREEDQFGTVKAPETIKVETGDPFIAMTPGPTARPAPEVMKAYYSMVRRDLAEQRKLENP